FFVALCFKQQRRAVYQRFGIVRRNAQSLAVGINGLFNFVLAVKIQRQVIHCADPVVVITVTAGALQLAFRFGVILGLRKQPAQIVAGAGKGAVVADGFAEILFGQIKLAFGLPQQAHGVVGRGIVFFNIQRFLQTLTGQIRTATLGRK